MARIIAYRGALFVIAFAKEKSGACPASEFFDGLGRLDQVKLMALFQIAGDHGKFYNPEKFGDLGGGLSNSSPSRSACLSPMRKASVD